MEEAVYFTLAGPLSVMHQTGQMPGRSGNQSGGAVAPYGVYPAKDGFIAIHTGTEGHWHNILDAAGRPELKEDPRYRTMHERSARMAETIPSMRSSCTFSIAPISSEARPPLPAKGLSASSPSSRPVQ